ncbi:MULTISPECIES: CBS domain-containing protein [Rhizobium/Agrobacterium group]|uniref:CBS domain-containing protein n=1 Tax=Agrobacterium tumefaciens TaxID=358 RepID=A0A4D7Z169_AGRTU|nr:MULTISPECIES: CBS domain-containing protein [Rhizobium/Agrobacterium group]MBS0259673.1 CBS domain-containing protein [Pseudomonadota bacterium]MCZ7495875.1 CBS domain-containing protein [Rhizobium rhizogenes]MBB4403590.1 CBS domain-containing protein [Agrobacterium radiobacter]MBB5589743.1 CBS domain-containing protein [Agrobacterium radiobacter]MBW9072008.1 CBS domain-containing protein [Agrobacterium deltaense]
MKVQEVMTHDVRVVNAEETIQEAARIMAEIDAGVLPVGKEGKLVGMLTDRDIAIRAVAEGKGPDTKASDIMSREVKYCFDDEDVEDVCGNLGDQQIRRIPVLDRNKQLVGILSLGDVAVETDGNGVGEALAAISRPGGTHSQSGVQPH